MSQYTHDIFIPQLKCYTEFLENIVVGEHDLKILAKLQFNWLRGLSLTSTYQHTLGVQDTSMDAIAP
jgi:hypothetical protein